MIFLRSYNLAVAKKIIKYEPLKYYMLKQKNDFKNKYKK